MSQAQPFDFRSAIQSAIAEFETAVKAKDAPKLATFYAEDATLLPPGSPMIRGRSNILEFWRGFLAAGASDPKLTIVSVEHSGDLASEIGTYEARVPDPVTGTVGPASGKYLVVWKRSGGGIKM